MLTHRSIAILVPINAEKTKATGGERERERESSNRQEPWWEGVNR